MTVGLFFLLKRGASSQFLKDILVSREGDCGSEVTEEEKGVASHLLDINRCLPDCENPST